MSQEVQTVETLWQDLRYGVRVLVNAPGFTAIAILTLALGIGANTAIFSVVNGVLLKPLPYPQPQKLVTVWGRFTGIGLPDDRNWISAPEFRDIQDLNHSFSEVAAMTDASFNIAAGSPERIEGAAVSPSLFPMLGIRPVVGRVFTPEEAQPGRDQELLLGYGLWARRFGSDPNVTGRTLDANGHSMTVVGVLPQGFDYPLKAEMWQPLAFSTQDLTPDNRGNHGYLVLGRIKPSLTTEQARSDMEAASKEMMARNPTYPYSKFNFTFLLVPLLEQTVGDVQAALWVLCGTVGFVLLIACVNIASLMLGRASAREREMAIRMVLGARRSRIVRQLLTESLLLAGLGGLTGLILAPFALREIVHAGNVALPRMANVKIDGGVLLFTVAIALLTGIVFGLFPAWQSARGTPYEDLKEGGRTSSEGGSSGRVRQALVICETALSIVLLVGAGLLMHSFLRVLGVDPGFHADRVLTMRVSLPQETYAKPEQVRAFYREVLRRIGHSPGVEAAGATAALPLSGLGGSGTTTIDTQAVPLDQRTPEADWRPVTPGYVEAIGMRVLRGRGFVDSDSETSAPVAVIDDTLAHSFFPNEDPVGKRLHLGGMGSSSPWLTIVGVVAHVHYRALEAPSRVQVYWPEAQRPYNTMSLAIRTSLNPLTLSGAVQQEIHAVDPDQPVYQIRSMEQLRSDWLSQRFLALLLVGLFAALALTLAVVGIYGVMSYAVTRRTYEMGIRLALGAQPGDVMGMILSQGSILVGIGLGGGIIAALGLTRLMTAMLYSVTPTDPLAYLGGAVLLALVALLACWIPARRAMRVDPIVALRYE
jgi:putative ABC transport system permease protein